VTRLFKALACDYDGTLASEDRMGEEARAALGQARAAGLRLILVTGRTFFELTRVCDCLDLFEAVVAENGAVLYYPAESMIRDQGPPPPERLLAELDRRRVYYQAGRVIVGTARSDEAAVREALATTDVTREVVYNRGALMLLPTGMSKGTGIQQAARLLGLSTHDLLALGDAENDLPLFDACGWSGCPASGGPEVRARADWIFPGENGQSIAAAIAGPILDGRLPPARAPRHHVALGWVVTTSEPVTIPVRGANMLIHGDPLSGKSWLAGSLMERLIVARHAVCILDVEGDYGVLARLPGATSVGIGEPREVERALGLLERDPAASLVLDFSALTHAEKLEAVEQALHLVRALRQRVGRPHWVLLDEAHYTLHRSGVSGDLGIAEDRGFCLVTYRPSWLRDDIMAAVDIFALARTTAAAEIEALASVLGAPSGDRHPLSDALVRLPRGEFLLLRRREEGGAGAVTFVAAPRQTVHVRHLTKYADSRVPPGREFLFRRRGGQWVASAESLHACRRVVATIEPDVLAHHAEHGDFSRWVRDVFHDAELSRQLRKMESRWRRDELADLRGSIESLIESRYGSTE
jgi:hydroxymethylpyrimidine pyrophosphatase-like HAD family hydrolase